jgi:hypothetical protein
MDVRQILHDPRASRLWYDGGLGVGGPVLLAGESSDLPGSVAPRVGGLPPVCSTAVSQSL